MRIPEEHDCYPGQINFAPHIKLLESIKLDFEEEPVPKEDWNGRVTINWNHEAVCLARAKRCPFCTGGALQVLFIGGRYCIECTDCYARGPSSGCSDRECAVERWNERRGKR